MLLQNQQKLKETNQQLCKSESKWCHLTIFNKKITFGYLATSFVVNEFRYDSKSFFSLINIVNVEGPWWKHIGFAQITK